MTSEASLTGSTGGGGRPPRKEPSLSPPAYVLNRHNGRMLDPTSAVVAPNQPTPRPTVYVGGQLLVRDGDLAAVEPLLAIADAGTTASAPNSCRSTASSMNWPASTT